MGSETRASTQTLRKSVKGSFKMYLILSTLAIVCIGSNRVMRDREKRDGWPSIYTCFCVQTFFDTQRVHLGHAPKAELCLAEVKYESHCAEAKHEPSSEHVYHCIQRVSTHQFMKCCISCVSSAE